MNPAFALLAALKAFALAAPAYLLVAGVLWLHIHSDRRAAEANRDRPVRLPRQLTSRTLDFDEYGRTGL